MVPTKREQIPPKVKALTPGQCAVVSEAEPSGAELTRSEAETITAFALPKSSDEKSRN